MRPVDIVPFAAWHLDYMRLQNSQLALSPLLTLAYGRSLEVAGPAYSAFAGMDVIACAGVVEFWTGRSQVWALLSDKMPRYAKSIHSGVRKFLTRYQVRRLECIVDPRSEAAIRWAERLGFEYESLMLAYTPDGADQVMMVRLER